MTAMTVMILIGPMTAMKIYVDLSEFK